MLKSGEKIEADLVVSGVGAKPMLDLYQGQIDTLDDKPGGIKVWAWPIVLQLASCTAGRCKERGFGCVALTHVIVEIACTSAHAEHASSYSSPHKVFPDQYVTTS